MPKYVGSNTLSGDLEWNATLLEGNLEDSIPKLKDEVDGDLFMHGSGEFAYALAEKGLIDEYEVYLTRLSGARETSTCSATGEPSGWNSPTAPRCGHSNPRRRQPPCPSARNIRAASSSGPETRPGTDPDAVAHSDRIGLAGWIAGGLGRQAAAFASRHTQQCRRSRPRVLCFARSSTHAPASRSAGHRRKQHFSLLPRRFRSRLRTGSSRPFCSSTDPGSRSSPTAAGGRPAVGGRARSGADAGSGSGPDAG
jgi:hypothetical protein